MRKKKLPPPTDDTNPKQAIVTSTGIIERRIPQERQTYQFKTPDTINSIEEMYLEGYSLHAISQMDGMPSYGALLRWMKDDADFRKRLDVARQVRARHFEEEAIRLAMAATIKEDVPAARLQFDACVWAAEVNNPQMYGKKTTIAGDLEHPPVFYISTGVPEKQDDKPIELNPDGTIKE